MKEDMPLFTFSIMKAHPRPLTGSPSSLPSNESFKASTLSVWF